MDEDLTYGLRGGLRSGAVGFQVTLGRVDTSSSEDGSDVDFELTSFDLSAVRYFGGERGQSLVYGGTGWAWLASGSASRDTFTLHAGFGWTSSLGGRSYPRPDARIRWFDERLASIEDIDFEVTLAIGWRW